MLTSLRTTHAHPHCWELKALGKKTAQPVKAQAHNQKRQELGALFLEKKINFIFSTLKKIEPAINFFLLRKCFFWCSQHLNFWTGDLVKPSPVHSETRATCDQPFTKVSDSCCSSLYIHPHHTLQHADHKKAQQAQVNVTASGKQKPFHTK